MNSAPANEQQGMQRAREYNARGRVCASLVNVHGGRQLHSWQGDSDSHNAMQSVYVRTVWYV